MSKVKQKVSGCFRTCQYAEAYCRISSYLQTMANQGYNPLVAIQIALSGQIYAETGE
jgi:transposase